MPVNGSTATGSSVISVTSSYRHHYAITGPNGSGKSTLLQVIAGAIGISEGCTVRYSECPPDQAIGILRFRAPYLDLIEEMTATEFLRFTTHSSLFCHAFHRRDIHCVGLAAAAQKQIRFFSSGMKQRIKLAQALFSDTPVVLLDEPSTNLDAEGIALYQRLIREYGFDRLAIVSSNDPQEYDFCEEYARYPDYKEQLTAGSRSAGSDRYTSDRTAG